ncbi:MAG: hypothetical protein JWO57_4010 [Pseudonocardiales bacterium]|nr:hypothetical protein [Pseudonocardiales bacterium]
MLSGVIHGHAIAYSVETDEQQFSVSAWRLRYELRYRLILSDGDYEDLPEPARTDPLTNDPPST